MLIEQLAGAVIHPVVSRCPAVAGLELAPLLVELGVPGADEVENVFLELAGDARKNIDQAMSVRRHEVDRRFTHTHLVHRPGDGLPPTAGVSRIAEVAAPHQPDDDPAFFALYPGPGCL